MSMEKTIIYLKAEQSSYVDHEMIHIGDIASVYCGDKKKEEEAAESEPQAIEAEVESKPEPKAETVDVPVEGKPAPKSSEE